MGIFDNNGDRIKYLEKENKEAWKRIVQLESNYNNLKKSLIKSTSESHSEASQNSKKTAEFRNKAFERLTEAESALANINKNSLESAKLLDAIKATKVDSIVLKEEQEELKAKYESDNNILLSNISTIKAFLEAHPDLDDTLQSIVDLSTDIESNYKKSTASLNAINTQRKEIGGFYDELFGYISKDDEGDEIHVEGKKESLDEVYSELAHNISIIESDVLNISRNYKEKYESFEKNHTSKYSSILKEIESLLPNALTAGLSAAFSTKKRDEAVNSIELQKRFNLGIWLMIGVSVIPIIISSIFIFQGKSFEDVIFKLPRIILSILPMYIPILWLTYSANKKLNLSKRLMEEYAHKEVLSKTYEGLSKQIAGLDNAEQTAELKFRLLSAFLQVASENPGKLISNYETSDHPVMDALEQSYKFQLAIDKLDGIPGLSKIAAVMESNTKRKLAEKEEKIENALEIEKNIDDNEI